MKIIIFILLLASNLLASNILSYKVYERSDRTDLLLTFDTPFNGRISQKDVLNTTTLMLYDTQYKAPIEEHLQSKFISKFSIIPQTNRTALVLILNDDIHFKVSKTVDNYGLRLRFLQNRIPTATTLGKKSPTIEKQKSKLVTQPDSVVGNRYLIVVVILFFAVLVLFLVKKKVQKNKGTGGGWLFKNPLQANEQFNILFQKPIDNVNKVVLMEVNDKQYLVVLGTSHLLLDSFDKQAVTEDGFESILQNNQQELDDYMKISDSSDKQDPLQSYKEKASLEAYRSHM